MQPASSFLREILFSTNPQKFSPSKVFRYTVTVSICGVKLQEVSSGLEKRAETLG